MYPMFGPMQVFVFWLDLLTLPWKMMMAPVADSHLKGLPLQIRPLQRVLTGNP